jgi:hypothetical protein
VLATLPCNAFHIKRGRLEKFHRVSDVIFCLCFKNNVKHVFNYDISCWSSQVLQKSMCKDCGTYRY